MFNEAQLVLGFDIQSNGKITSAFNKSAEPNLFQIDYDEKLNFKNFINSIPILVCRLIYAFRVRCFNVFKQFQVSAFQSKTVSI